MPSENSLRDVGETTGCEIADITAKLASLLTLKTVLAVLTVAGVVIAFLDILGQMGCMIAEGKDFIEVVGTEELMGLDVDMRDIPDTAQTLAVVAPFAASPTRIRGIASARVKETDRVHATCMELSQLGVHVEEHEDGMTIYPCDEIQPASIQTYNDHRMAMAFALIGLRVDGVRIENPSCVSKTFPNYFEVLDTLR